MLNRSVFTAAISLALCVFAGAVFAADTLSADQQDVWKLEQQQWKMAAAKDQSWIDTMVHANLKYWETGTPMPRDKARQRCFMKPESLTLMQKTAC